MKKKKKFYAFFKELRLLPCHPHVGIEQTLKHYVNVPYMFGFAFRKFYNVINVDVTYFAKFFPQHIIDGSLENTTCVF